MVITLQSWPCLFAFFDWYIFKKLWNWDSLVALKEEEEEKEGGGELREEIKLYMGLFKKLMMIIRFVLGFCVVSSLVFTYSAAQTTQTCFSYSFSSNRNFSTCRDLPHQNAFLHWTYDQSTGDWFSFFFFGFKIWSSFILI